MVFSDSRTVGRSCSSGHVLHSPAHALHAGHAGGHESEQGPGQKGAIPVASLISILCILLPKLTTAALLACTMHLYVVLFSSGYAE
jgi:hypothetical protein